MTTQAPRSTLFPYTTLFRSMILKRTKEEDLEKVSSIIEDRGFSKTPSMMRFLYKNRGGIPDIIMWTHIDSATIREECLEYQDRKSTRLNSSHVSISYAVFCL